MSLPNNSQDYIVVEKVLADGEIPVTLYQNEITGLRIVLVDIESPIVKGDLVFATEAFDDDGLPHTLEHLVFLGSEDYPFKGVLDLLANRCLADGTNAYTDTDHTNYTLSTAGSDGFLNLLPIYLDHVLFPILADSAYTTEVHHINADGEDAGIVYCEMQAKENSGESRCHLEMLRSLYPGKCGYKSETGGLLENLRTSTNNSKVQNYHKEFYHAKNLCLVVTGPVDPEAVFRAIRPIEDKIVAKELHKMEFVRPWQAPVEPMPISIERKIQYSSDTDDDGLVYIAYRGPNVVDNYRELIALSILLDYLDSTAISPIQRDFVECLEPYCSSVSHYIIENSISCFYFTFENVGMEYLDLVLKKLNSLLGAIVKGEEKIDMDRMQNLISRKIVRVLSVAESSPHSLVIGPIIGHFLYGNGSIQDRCLEIPILKEYMECDAQFWIELIDKYMLGGGSRYACIIGEPSPELMKLMSETERKRLEKQKEDLKDNLNAIAQKLKDAISLNGKTAPMEMLQSVEIPSLDNIKFHSIGSGMSSKLPFDLYWEDVKTNFVTIRVLLNTSSLNKSQRLFLPLLSEILLELPIQRGSTVVPYEQIVAELFSDTVSYCSSIGISSSSFYNVGVMGTLFEVSMQVEIPKYSKAIDWYRDLLFNTIFDPERVKTTVTRMVSDISQLKRSGGKMTTSTSNAMAYQSNSNQWAANFLRQQKFLKQLLMDLKTDPKKVQDQLTCIRDIMTQTENIRVHVALDKRKLGGTDSIIKYWEENLMIPGDRNRVPPNDIVPCHKLLQFNSGVKAAIVGLGSVESNYLHQFVKSINDPNHSDVPPVYVLIQYLTQLEGPLWRHIRGLGLSYNYSIQLSPHDGLMYLLLYKSSHVTAAYKKSVEIIDLYLRGEEEFEDNLFESAKSSLIFEFIRREKSPLDKAMQIMLSKLRGLDIDFNKNLMERVAAVTKEDLKRVAPIYLKPLFEDIDRRTVVCCNPSKIDEIVQGFNEVSCSLEKINLDEEPFLTSITV